MFELFTEKARRVIFFARYEASSLNSREIEPAHLLLGLLREDKGLFSRLGCELQSQQQLKDEVLPAIGPGPAITVSVDLPLSQAAKRVLAYAAEERERLNSANVSPGHVLSGLLREDAQLSVVLKRYGIELERVRADIVGQTGGKRHPDLSALRKLREDFTAVAARLDSNVEPSTTFVLEPLKENSR